MVQKLFIFENIIDICIEQARSNPIRPDPTRPNSNRPDPVIRLIEGLFLSLLKR